VRIPGRNNRDADILSLVYDWLRDASHGNWVLILDNADDKELFASRPSKHRQFETEKQIRDFLPQSSNGSTLITSRSREAAYQVTCNYRHIITVEPMTEMESMALLRSQLEDTHPEYEMKLLGETLGFVPLALSQAAANISRRSLPITDYLQELANGSERSESLLDESSPQLRRDSGRSNSIVATWRVTFEYVRRTTPSAARLLSLMCLFDRQNIPETLLQRQYGEEINDKSSKPRKPWWRRRPRSKRRKEQPAPAKLLPCDFEDDWLTLRDFSLIKLNKDRRHFSMHPMVQFTTKRWLVLHGELDTWSHQFISIMDTNFPNPEHGKFKLCEPFISHAYAAVPYRPSNAAIQSLRKWATLTRKVASYYNQISAFEMAQKLYDISAEGFETCFGSNAPHSLECHSERGIVLFHMGREPEAERLHRRILNLRTTSLGPLHTDTLASMDHLGDALATLKRHAEAETLHIQALDTRLRTLGPAHETSQRALDKRGTFLFGRSRYTEAYDIWTRAYDARTQSSKSEFDPGRANELDILGLRLLMSGDLVDAARFFQLAVAEKEKAPPGADLMHSLANLARVRLQQADFPGAEGLFARALACPNVTTHPARLQIAHELATVLSELERLDEAGALMRRCLAERMETLGPKHRDVSESMWLVGRVLEKQGKLDEALGMLERACKGAMEVLGEGHADTKEYVRDCARVREEVELRGRVVVPVGSVKILTNDLEERSYSDYEDAGVGAQEVKDAVVEEDETGGELVLPEVCTRVIVTRNDAAAETNAGLEFATGQASFRAMQKRPSPRAGPEALKRTALFAS
jgi:tetratricopeptide (TPR) repeat protein